MFPNAMRTLSDFQAFHRWLDEQKGFDRDIFFNAMLLSGEVGELTQVLKKVRIASSPQRSEAARTYEEALAAYRKDLGDELADCLAYLLKLANYAGIDLQEAYLRKMERNLERTWRADETEA